VATNNNETKTRQATKMSSMKHYYTEKVKPWKETLPLHLQKLFSCNSIPNRFLNLTLANKLLSSSSNEVFSMQ